MGVADAAPGEVGDVHEAVHTAQVDEDAVAGDVLDGSFEHLALFELRHDLLLLGFELGLDEGLVADDDVLELLVDLDNLELHRLLDEDVVVAYGLDVDLAAGQECLDAEDVDNHAALRAALDEAFDHLLVFKGLVDAVPGLGHAGFLVGEHELAFLVLLALYEHLDGVAHLEVGVVAELAGGDDAVALALDADRHFALADGDYLALDDLVFLHAAQGGVVALFGLLAVFGLSQRAVFEGVPVEVGQRDDVFVILHGEMFGCKKV